MLLLIVMYRPAKRSPNQRRSATAQLSESEKARKIHNKVIVLDSHVDFEPNHLTDERNYTERVETQFNLPNMIDGGIDATFFVVYVGQTREHQKPDAFKAEGYERAYDKAVAKFDAVHHFATEIAAGTIVLATNVHDLHRVHNEGKKAALIGVENGYPLGEDLDRVKEFYRRGARYLSLTHNGHNQLADSHTGERDGWKWHGLSPLGKQVISELNRCGIMVDVSHAAKSTMLQSAELSRAPVIASHSSVRALCDVSRNLDDEQLVAIKQSGGVIQIVAYDMFLKKFAPDSAERKSLLDAVRQEYNLPDPNHFMHRARYFAALKSLPGAERQSYEARLGEIDELHPSEPPASLRELADHIDYAVKLIGIDHVGIASDFDGGGGIAGWSDASETLNVTFELVRRGYGETQIAKLWGGNLLRVMHQTEEVARALRH